MNLSYKNVTRKGKIVISYYIKDTNNETVLQHK